MRGPTAKRKSSELGGSKAKRGKVVEHNDNVYRIDSVFRELVSKSGMTLKTGKEANTIHVYQAVFQRDLRLNIKSASSGQPKVIDDFIDGLQTYLEEPGRFHWSLLPSDTFSETDTSVRRGKQECLIRLLLGVDSIQPKLMSLLLEKLPEFMGEEDSIFEQGEKINIPRLIVSQFRWLDKIVDSKELTSKMLDIMTITSVDIQREIISCLPEVVDDEQHADVATALRDRLLEGNSLTAPILDALSNLTLQPELTAEVRDSVIQTLLSVETEDLPVVTKFLLQSITGPDAVEVIGQMRSNLTFDPSMTARSGTQQGGRKHKDNSKSVDSNRCCEALTLDAIKSGIRFQNSVAQAWIKTIEGVKLPADHKVVDIFVLLILHTTSRKKVVESLVRNKIRAGCFTDVLLQTAFKSHAVVMREYFPSILSLAEVLLRSPEPAISYFACSMYKEAFATLDTYCKQEIVGTLVTHTGSGFEGEIDASLDILTSLVESHLKSMAPFAVFVKGVLDYLDNLTVAQIRKLYSMLSELAFRNPKDGALIQDDLHIVIHKQLSNHDQKYRRMGVIGAIMVVKSMAYSKTGNSGDAGGTTLADDVYRQVVSLLQLVKTSVTKSPEATALFMDELSTVIASGHLDGKVEAWIGDNVINDFQDDYVIDIDPETLQKEELIPMDLLFGLDDEAEGNIAINMLPLIIKSYENKDRRDASRGQRIPSGTCLAAHFRLVRICEQRQQNNDLEGIDALLGCPLYVCKEGVEEKMKSLSNREKDIICNTVFQTLNWFREVVNGFATQSEPEMKAKVITRLQNITDGQRLLMDCLKAHPTFQPPKAVFDLEDKVSKPLTIQVKTTGTKKGAKKGGKRKKGSPDVTDQTIVADEGNADETVVPDRSQDTQPTQGSTQSPGREAPTTIDKSLLDLAQLRPYFRELDIDVFTILKSGFITKAALDSEMNTKVTTNVQIQPPQLLFLLDDLSRKLNHSLLSSASKRRTFLKTKSDKKTGFAHLEQLSAQEIAIKVGQLLPTLCQNLEGASGFFQTLTEENDGVIDGPGSSTPEAETMATCFNLLIQIFLSFFSWNGFLLSENREMLKEALSVLVSRINQSGPSQYSSKDLVKNAFRYVEKFSATVPNLSTAVCLLKLLICLSEKADEHDMEEVIAKDSEVFLKREWLDREGERQRGAKHNEHLHVVIKTYLTYSEDSLEATEQLTTKAIPELLDEDKNGCSKTFPTLDRHSFPVYFKVMLTELVATSKDIEPVKKSDSVEIKLERLIKWNMAVRIFHVFINLIKAFDNRANIGSALKYGRLFLDVFLRQGMPMLDHLFRDHREDVQGLLKNLQLSTRAMHHICSHSKIVKDLSLTNQVPMVKRSLETFVFRVKAMLTYNKCLEAFWVGNLKNRDLQGAEILSQTSAASSQQEESEEEDERQELPEEDEDSDVEVDDQSNDGGHSKPADGDDDENSLSPAF